MLPLSHISLLSIQFFQCQMDPILTETNILCIIAYTFYINQINNGKKKWKIANTVNAHANLFFNAKKID